MRAMLAAFALTVALPLAGCAGGDTQSEAAATISVTVAMADKSYRFDVEVARTIEEQRQGLMFRTNLPADGGMLFVYDKPQIASFWMKNTVIPLDMIFIRVDGSIDRIAENTIPESLEPVASGGEVAAVLEVAGGTAARLGIDESATVTWADR